MGRFEENDNDNSVWMEVAFCPWCGSNNRVKSTRYSLKPNHYLSDLAQLLSTNTKELLANMIAFKCIDCNTSYLDPFINEEILRRFFSERKYSHRTGWGKLMNTVKKGNSSSTYKSSLNKFMSVSNFFDGSYQYYEVGCPFMGFLPLLSNRGDLEKTVSNFYKDQARHFHENNYGSIIPNSIAIQVSRIRRLNSYLSLRRFQNPFRNESVVPKRIGLIVTNSYLMWGPNCVGDQGICPLVAKRTLGVENLAIDDLKSANNNGHNKNRKRIMSFMNTLDHQVNPRELFEFALSSSEYVLVEIHSGGAIEKQHAFVLDETLLNDHRLIAIFDSRGRELIIADALGQIYKETNSADLLMVFKGEESFEH